MDKIVLKDYQVPIVEDAIEKLKTSKKIGLNIFTKGGKVSLATK